jgi:hypothetical protein
MLSRCVSPRSCRLVARRVVARLGLAGLLIGGSIADTAGSESAAPTTFRASSQATFVTAATFADRRVGSPRISYSDPEFWPDGNYVTWQNKRTGDNWIGRVDPNTGTFLPTDGQAIRIGIGKKIVSSDVPGAFNGPEFGVSGNFGLCVYYTLEDQLGSNQVARFSLATRQTVFVTSGSSVQRSGALPSSDPSAPFAGVATFNFGPVTSWDPTWRLENQPSLDLQIPNALRGTSGPRWVPGRMQIVTNARDTRGVVQIALYDCATRQSRIVTEGGTLDRSEGSPFFAPEFENRLAFWCLEGEGLAMFVEDGPGQPFLKVKEFPQPEWNDRRINIFSVEAATFNGRSYCAFGGSPKKRLPWVAENEVLLAGFDLEAPLMLTRPGDGRNCLDPELVELGGNFYLYYTWQKISGNNEIHVVSNFVP